MIIICIVLLYIIVFMFFCKEYKMVIILMSNIVCVDEICMVFCNIMDSV